MEILILGGTQFVGRHLVEASLDAGHRVTLFNRGKTNPGLYPQAEELHGDRDGNLSQLEGRTWDVVFDVNGYVPRIVRQSVDLLQGQVGHYVFVSSISVYAGLPNHNAEDSSPLHQLDEPTTETITGETYGGLKVLCEHVVFDVHGDNALAVRPGFVVGRYDHIARLPYLIKRFRRGGERLAGRADQPVQIIHARDLADWMLGAVAQNLSGAYNLTGTPFPMAALLQSINRQVEAENTLVYTSDAFLQQHEVAPIDGLTFWVPQQSNGVMQVTTEKALNTGLKLRSVDETVQDLLSWDQTSRAIHEHFNDDPRNVLLTNAREADLLAAWHSR